MTLQTHNNQNFQFTNRLNLSNNILKVIAFIIFTGSAILYTSSRQFMGGSSSRKMETSYSSVKVPSKEKATAVVSNFTYNFTFGLYFMGG